ncbi:MAG: Na/Pi cotransporter family protein [Clostridiales bacterium]|nr:Na/Pi cotransporter family protein [Clostridiales bacterium]
MDIFNVLTMIGGLCLFLFGMNIMGQALERRAGNKLRLLLGKLTTGKAAGLLTGLGVTAVIQSSSATTVMVVGFVNSGLMTLKQSINVIMGANIGTTVTAWILSLAGIDGGNVFVKLLKPASFTPVLALVGIIFYMFCKSSKKKDTGMILLGFATLMFGMETMSGAVSGLGDISAFQNLFLLFKNPVLGVLAGAVLTAIIQSSSASVGILQALAVTGQVSYGAAIPIIMGQNIGTCVTAMISSVGANKNAKRAAMVHLSFNVIGTAVWLTIFCIIKAIFSPMLLNESASLFGIAVVHSAFNILCTVLMLPLTGFLEKLVNKLIPDSKNQESKTELDERLFATPSIALERCHKVAVDMAQTAVQALEEGLSSLHAYTPVLAESIRKKEDITDRYEDMLGTYLVHLSTKQISEQDSTEAAKLLKIIGDFERIADHGVNLLDSAEEMKDKSVTLSETARAELEVISSAVHEILGLALAAFLNDDIQAAQKVEPLEQVIDALKEKLRTSHILRMQQSRCSIDAGFIWSDLLTNLERTSDHCSNIAGCVIDIAHHNMNIHESLREFKNDSDDFKKQFQYYTEKYNLAKKLI